MIKYDNKGNHIVNLLQPHRCWAPSQKACAVLSVIEICTMRTCYGYVWHNIGIGLGLVPDVPFSSGHFGAIFGYSSNIQLVGRDSDAITDLRLDFAP